MRERGNKGDKNKGKIHGGVALGEKEENLERDATEMDK